MRYIFSAVLLLLAFLLLSVSSCKSKKGSTVPEQIHFILDGKAKPYQTAMGKGKGVLFQINIIQPQGIDLKFLKADVLLVEGIKLPVTIGRNEIYTFFEANYLVSRPEPSPGEEITSWDWNDYPILKNSHNLSGVLYVKYKDMEYQISIPFDLETN